MPAPTSTAELLELVAKSGVVPAGVLESALAGLELPADPARAAGALVKGEVLTPFQAKLLLAGRHKGFRLGPYLVRDLLGRGGMGAVYLAEHDSLKRRVALKVLAPSEGSSRVATGRFLREARAAAALDHPNVVRIFDVCHAQEPYYLVMEYAEGRTLAEVVARDGPLPARRAATLIAQAALGLQHAHERGIVHRDIKPANLMLATGGVLKILDMGLARAAAPADQLTRAHDAGAVAGTADTISPEQAMNAPDLDTRSDIYSLGATFVMLATGRPLFAGNTAQKLLQHQLKEPPSLADLGGDFPPGLAVVVAKMLRKRPAERQQTPAEVAEELREWARPAGAPVPESVAAPAPAKRRRAWEFGG